MTIDEQIEILKAVKEGKKVEARLIEGESEWFSWHLRVCNFERYLYRIVPEPRRFIIYTWLSRLHVVPYGNHVPDDAKIICTAVEEENIKTADLARWCVDEAAKLVAQTKPVGTPPA